MRTETTPGRADRTDRTGTVEAVKRAAGKRKRRFLIVAVAAVLCLFAVFVAIDDVTVQLEDYDYYSYNLPLLFFGYRIICIADYHDSFFYSQISNYINREKPDMVVFLGDMTKLDACATDNLGKLMAEINYGPEIYGVIGDHEAYYAQTDELVAKFEEMGIHILRNESVSIERNGETITLIGMEDPGVLDKDVGGSWQLGENLNYLKENVKSYEFTVLLNHRASMYPYYRSSGCDLMLSGDSHGGLVRFPVVGGIIGENGELFPKYDAGFYKGATDLFVSRGCDFDLSKPRVLNGPELVQITLKNR